MAAAKKIRMGDAVSAVSSELDGIYVSTLFTLLFKHSLIKIHLSLSSFYVQEGFRQSFSSPSRDWRACLSASLATATSNVVSCLSALY